MGEKKGEEGKKDDKDWKALLNLSDEEATKEIEKDKAKEGSKEREDSPKEKARSWMADIKVDFDKTKHLTDEKIEKRKEKMDKWVQEQKDKAEKEQRRKEEEFRRKEE